MINIDQLKTEFNAKLAKTNSMDAAFTKAVWLAFKAGAVETAAHAEFAQELAELCDDLSNARSAWESAAEACRGLERDLLVAREHINLLVTAGDCVVKRWESPDWAKVAREGEKHTGALIHDLRFAVSVARGGKS